MSVLHVLPTRTAGAAENMAVDFLLLQRYPDAVPRFRHYEWRGPAFTFGYSQKIEFVRSQVPRHEALELCRRPTGGGLVDHRNDWTYALVLPRTHPLYDERATQSYRIVHECVAAALKEMGHLAEVKMTCAPDAPCAEELVAGVCFQRAELHDVVNSHSGVKIAGAAQKRNKHGLLFQGSISKSSIPAIDWEGFRNRFVKKLAQALAVEPVETGWPDLNEDEVTGLVEQYSDPQWIEYR